MSTRNASFCASVSIALLVATGCNRGDRDGGEADNTADETGDDDNDLVEGPAPTARMFRLTHAQWENTVRDLFYLDEPLGFSSEFRTDPYQSGFLFDNNFGALSVDSLMWDGYRVAAARVAKYAVDDPDIVAAILPDDDLDDDTLARAFVADFGARAFRRPLTSAEVSAYAELFADGPKLYPETDDALAGVQFVIEALLQSPYFLYRVELSASEDDTAVPLSSWEMASRLSYFLWNSMPDDKLLSAAEDDELGDDELEKQIRRMLASEQAADTVAHFHEQLFDLEEVTAIRPSSAMFPEVSGRLGEHAKHEAELFLREVVFEDDGGFADLMLSPETYVNAELAAIYGIAGDFDDEFERVSLDDEQRAGLFTQVGFLAANATSVDPDPIHRGVFMAKRMACNPIPAPPDNITPLPPADGRTNRETVEAHTEAPGTVCAACHATTINPFGFPFENYDAVGAWRDRDNGSRVDATSEVRLGDETIAVDNALDLVHALASSRVAHDCYARHWIEFATGRPSNDYDSAWTARLGATSLEDAASVRDLLVELATSVAFTHRAAEEL